MPSRPRLTVFLALSTIALTSLALVACAESPSSEADDSPAPSATSAPSPDPVGDDEPTRPDTDADPGALVITTAGLGSLVIGKTPEQTELLRFADDYCVQSDFYEPGDPAADRWVASPSVETLPDGRDPFSVAVVDGLVMRIDIHSDSYLTERAIGRGATKAEFMAAYPDAIAGETTEVSSVYYVEGPTGAIAFEITSADYYDTPVASESLEWIRILGPGMNASNTVAGTDNVAGTCV